MARIRWDRSHGIEGPEHPARPTTAPPNRKTLTTQRSDSELTCLPQRRRGRGRVLSIRHRPRRLRRQQWWLVLGRLERTDRTHGRDVQRLRLHGRALPGVHGREPERDHRPQQGRDVQRRARQLLPEARQDRPRRHRGDRGRLAPRGHEVLRPARAGPRRPDRPLARLEGPGRDRPRRQPDRLRHRHRPRGHLLSLRPVRRGGSAHRPRRASPTLFERRLGELLRRSVSRTRPRPARRSSTPRAAPTRA